MRITIEKDLRVPTRDGVELATDLYLPQSDGPVPTLLSRTPYDKEVAAIVNLPVDVLRVVRAGYAVVVQDARGCGGSTGTWVPFRDEAADGEDAIAWIASQPWSDGTVGMFGQSYVGHRSGRPRAAGRCARRADLHHHLRPTRTTPGRCSTAGPTSPASRCCGR